MAVALPSVVTGSPQGSALMRPAQLKSKRKMNSPSKTAAQAAASANSAAGKRRVIFGIEVESEVAFRGWEIGRAYTKKITLKNVTFQAQKLRFQAPASEVFVTLYPKAISLSPGTSFVIPVTFRPVIRQVHDDAMVFQTSDGNSFEVPLRGLLPQYQMQLPRSLDFGVGATHDILTANITICNTSELETQYRWQSVAPFEFAPSKGVLPPYESEQITITFQPEEAQSYQLDAALLYGDKLQCCSQLRLTGVAKYTQVMFFIDGTSLDEVTSIDGKLIVDFGKVAFGDCRDRMIQLRNPSTVGATVEIKRLDNIHPIDRVFDCPVSNSPIPSGEMLNVALRYSPKLPWTKSAEYFHVRVSNKCGNLVIKCIGQCLGPKVTASCKLINFQLVKAGQLATHPIQLENHTDRPTSYEFDMDPTLSVFHIDSPSGQLQPRSRKQLLVTFRPQLAMQYHRRVAILVPDLEPMYLDLLGTCHDIYLRPNVLQPQHLLTFRLRNERGIGYYPPEQLEAWLRSGKLAVSPDDDSLLVPAAELWEAECDPCERLSPWPEFFFGDGHGDVVYSAPHVALEATHLDFGRVGLGAALEEEGGTVSRSLCLRNNTKGVVIFNWTPDPPTPARKYFEVEPRSLEIPASSSATVKVIFRPDGANKIFSCQLEGFAAFKSQRDFQIVNEKTLAPPFCVTLSCIGHTFSERCEPFQPHFKFDHEQLVFPSVNVGEMFFRSVAMQNTGETPIYFNVTDLNAPFAVKPACGVVQPGDYRVFSVKCVPHKMDQFVSALNLRLNERPDAEALIPLLGSADEASVLLDNKSELYFPATNVGNSLTRNFSIKNTSRVPLLFEWSVAPSESERISVQPSSGRLEPNESLAQSWEFSPSSVGKQMAKPRLIVQGVSRTGALMRKSSFPLRIIGLGSSGSISAVEPYVDYGTMVVGSSAVRGLTLLNQSDCPVYYRLVVSVVIDGPYDEKQLAEDPSTLELSQVEGWIQARCKQLIRATVRPMRRVFYQYKLAYYPMSNPDESGACQPLSDEPQHLCHLLSTGVYPSVEVTDVQGCGSARRLKKKLLWEYFSIDEMNKCLHADPTPSELVYTVATRQSFCRTPRVMTRAVLDLNFGAAPVGSEESSVHLLLENKGHVTSQFHFLMPDELQLELEYWAETGEYTDEELHQLKVQNRRLFKVTPAKAELPPGASAVVQLTYLHQLPSTDRLPVLLKVNKGREILLNFTGVTTDPGRSYLHFHSSRHTFNPVPIGEVNPSVQVYDLYNGGQSSLKFEVDCSGLVESRLENYDSQVLECLTPRGEIPAGRSFELQFKFCPIEARTYTFEVPVQIVDGETAVIAFTGVGFDKRVLGDSQPAAKSCQEVNVATRQAITLKDQLAILSEERLSFGNIPVFSRNRRVVFLNNTSLDKPVQFQWHVTHRAHSQIVTISPPNGRLNPGESVLCHLTLVPDANPRFHDLDLICEVDDLGRLEQWSVDLAEWEEELKRRQVEFTITEQDVEAEARAAKAGKTQAAAIKVQNQKSSSGSSSSSNNNNSSSSSSNSKGKSSSSSSSTSGSGSGKYRKTLSEQDLMRKPVRPNPFLLHLGVTAQSHNIQDYRTQFPDLWEASCMDRTLVQTQRRQEAEGVSEQVTQIPAEDYEGTIVELAVSNVLHSLLGDADLIAAVTNVQNEPVPFYRQLPQAKAKSLGQVASNTETVTATATAARSQSSPLASAVLDEQSETQRDTQRSRSSSAASCPSQPEDNSPKDSNRSLKSSSGTNGFGREAEELERETVLKSPQFATLCETVLENILVNIMAEANQREFDVTARPRLIALPPRRKSRTTPQGSQR